MAARVDFVDAVIERVFAEDGIACVSFRAGEYGKYEVPVNKHGAGISEGERIAARFVPYCDSEKPFYILSSVSYDGRDLLRGA